MPESPTIWDETSQQRTRRIPLDYYRSLTRLDALKWLLSAAAFVVAGGYVLWIWLGWAAGSEGAARQLSPGPVAGVHQVWEGQCAACHLPLAPLRGDAHGVRALGFHGQQSEGKCQACHTAAPHHPVKAESDQFDRSCADCHRDHQGRDVDLTRVADATCTDCHANLAGHTDQPPQVLDVAGFGPPPLHPPFESLKSDPGNITFNHALHMLPWQRPTGARPDSRPRTSTIEQLQCRHCHEPDSAGMYMQPIRYDQHCARCHAGDLRLSGDLAGQVPHGLNPQGVRQILVGLAAQDKVPPAPLTPRQPIPGRKSEGSLTNVHVLDAPAMLRIAAAEQTLSGAGSDPSLPQSYCAKCHAFEPAADSNLMPAVLPASIPTVWLSHARFNHAAHRGVKCLDCHPKSQKSEDVMIADVEKCVQCHAPRTAAGGGARHDCAECHRFHSGEIAFGGQEAAQAN